MSSKSPSVHESLPPPMSRKSPSVHKSLPPPSLTTIENRQQLPPSKKSSLVHKSLPPPSLTTIGNRQQLSSMNRKSPPVHKNFSSLTLKSFLQSRSTTSLSLLENYYRRRRRYLPSLYFESLF